MGSLGRASDYIERVVRPSHTSSRVNVSEELVGRTSIDGATCRETLRRISFEDNGNHSLVRKIDSEGNARRLHVFVYDGSSIERAPDQYSYIYAHSEPDPFARPLAHFLGRGIDPHDGVRRTKALLDEYGIPYDPIAPPQ